MSTINVLYPSLADVVSLNDPKGGMHEVVEILSQVNDVIPDVVWKEANQPTSHISIQRTSLPTTAARNFNEGVAPSKGQTQQITDTMTMLHSWSRMDRDLANLANDPAQYRADFERPYIESMAQEYTRQLFYGNPNTEIKEYLGFTGRFNTLSNPQVFGGGSNDTDNSSIWLIGWGPNTVYGIYPKSQDGSAGGVAYYNHGEDIAIDSSGRMFTALVSEWKWHCGLVVEDPRYVVRACNIEISDLLKDAGSGSADLINLMTRMIEEGLWSTNGCKPVFYTTRKVLSFIRQQAVAAVKNATITFETIAGKHVTMFDGIPVRRVDQLTATEALVS